MKDLTFTKWISKNKNAIQKSLNDLPHNVRADIDNDVLNAFLYECFQISKSNTSIQIPLEDGKIMTIRYFIYLFLRENILEISEMDFIKSQLSLLKKDGLKILFRAFQNIRSNYITNIIKNKKALINKNNKIISLSNDVKDIKKLEKENEIKKK